MALATQAIIVALPSFTKGALILSEAAPLEPEWA
jgi:hypothetical protein